MRTLTSQADSTVEIEYQVLIITHLFTGFQVPVLQYEYMANWNIVSQVASSQDHGIQPPAFSFDTHAHYIVFSISHHMFRN